MARSTRSRKSVKAVPDATIETPVVETPVVPVVPPVETPAEPVVPPTPPIHLLPLYLGRMAEHADTRDSASRFALNGVLVEFKAENRFVAVTTDTKHLVHIEGQCVAPPEEFPDALIPALATAPNGATKAVVPWRVWRESFRKAKSLTRRTHKTALKSLAVVTSETVTTLAATDSEATQCDTSANVVGKYAPYEDILAKTRKDGQRELRVAVDARMLAGLLLTVADYNDDDSIRAELVFRFSDPRSEDVKEGETPPNVLIEKPFLVEAKNLTSKLTGLVMPLAG